MSVLGEGNGPSWPSSVDTRETQVDQPAVGKTLVDANLLNDILKALVAIETELGTDPAGSLTDLKTRLAVSLNNDGSIKDPELSAIAGLVSAADKLAYFTGSGTASLADLTAAARSLLDDATVGAMLTTLGLTTFVKTLMDDASAGDFLTTLGISTFIKTLLDDADAGTARTTLGVAIGSNVQAFDADTSITDVAETRAASINMADNILQRPKIKDYGETVNDIGATGGGTQDIDLELGNVAILMVTTSANTFTFSNWPAAGIQGTLTLKIFGGGTQTVNWPSVMKGDIPTLTDNTAAFTTDFGTDEKLDITAHEFMNGDRVQVTSSDTLPAGLSANTIYFIINKTDNDFELSLMEGGAAVNITDDGTGTHTCHSGFDVYIIETDNSGLTLNIYAAKEDMK